MTKCEQTLLCKLFVQMILVMARNNTVRCCYFSALVLTCYRLKKGRATFYQPETIVANLLLLTVLFFKVIFNHTSKRQFMVLHFHICLTIYEIEIVSSFYSFTELFHFVLVCNLRNYFLSSQCFFFFFLPLCHEIWKIECLNFYNSDHWLIRWLVHCIY